jgi:hypothetical protein
MAFASHPLSRRAPPTQASRHSKRPPQRTPRSLRITATFRQLSFQGLLTKPRFDLLPRDRADDAFRHSARPSRRPELPSLQIVNSIQRPKDSQRFKRTKGVACVTPNPRFRDRIRSRTSRRSPPRDAATKVVPHRPHGLSDRCLRATRGPPRSNTCRGARASQE